MIPLQNEDLPKADTIAKIQECTSSLFIFKAEAVVYRNGDHFVLTDSGKCIGNQFSDWHAVTKHFISIV